MTEWRTAAGGAALLACLFVAPGMAIAETVGTVAAVEGAAEVVRNGAWNSVTAGTDVGMGDELRTGADGRVQVVFQDESVLSLGSDSQVKIDENVFDPSGGTSTSLLTLLRGKVNTVVSDYYGTAGSRYEIRTPTAVSGVRGTEFIVLYDPLEKSTDVVVVSGIVSVHSTVDPTGPGVLVTASEITSVENGELPAPPDRLEGPMFDELLDDFEFIGAGQGGVLSGGHAIVVGSSVPLPDQAAGLATQVAGGGGSGALSLLDLQKTDASTLAGVPPAVVKSFGQLGLDLGQPK